MKVFVWSTESKHRGNSLFYLIFDKSFATSTTIYKFLKNKDLNIELVIVI